MGGFLSSRIIGPVVDGELKKSCELDLFRRFFCKKSPHDPGGDDTDAGG